MYIKQLFTATLISCALTSVTAAESYLCVADHAAGIAYDKVSKRWSSAVFRAEEKLLLSIATPLESKLNLTWIVKNMGSGFPSYVCNEGFNDAGYIFCTGSIVSGEFTFNRKNGRYLSTYLYGYFNDQVGDNSLSRQEGDDTPVIKAGRCSPVQ